MWLVSDYEDLKDLLKYIKNIHIHRISHTISRDPGIFCSPSMCPYIKYL